MRSATGVSAILVSYNTRDLLLEAVRSLRAEGVGEIVVLDNASQDGSADALAAEFPDVHLIRSSENVGFAAGVNRAVASTSGPWLLLLNPDAHLEPGAIEEMVAVPRCHPRAAMVGAALTYGDGAPQDSAFRFPGMVQLFLDLFPISRLMSTPLNGRYRRAERPHRVDVVLGACVLIRRDAWEDVGRLDEGYFMYVEEVDWCRRARARGWEVWHQPRARAVHHGGQSARQQADRMFVALWRSRLRYYALHHGPAYNRLVRVIVRLGMRAARRHTLRQLDVTRRRRRLDAIGDVLRMVS